MINRFFNQEAQVYRLTDDDVNADIEGYEAVTSKIPCSYPQPLSANTTAMIDGALYKMYSIYMPIASQIYEHDKLLVSERYYIVSGIEIREYGMNPHKKVICQLASAS